MLGEAACLGRIFTDRELQVWIHLVVIKQRLCRIPGTAIRTGENLGDRYLQALHGCAHLLHLLAAGRTQVPLFGTVGIERPIQVFLIMISSRMAHDYEITA